MGANGFRITWPLLIVLLSLPARLLTAQEPPSPEEAPKVESKPPGGKAEEPQTPPSPPPPEEDPKDKEKIGAIQDIDDVDLADLLSPGGSAAVDGRALDDVPGIVSVITEDEIRRLGARTLEDVLETVPGFEVLTDNLGRGRVLVRGIPTGSETSGSDGVLILLNGHRLNEAIHGGATAVNLDIPVDNVKRIEVRRSPGSVLDGPGAFLAVINVITETVDTFRKDEVALGGGSFSTLHYNFRYGTTIRGVSLAGFLQFARSQGPDLTLPEDAQTLADRAGAGQGLAAVSRAPGPIDDDRKSVDANLAVAFKGLSINGRLKEEDAAGFVGLLDALGRQNRLSNKQVVVDADYRHALGERATLRGRLTFAQSEMAEFLDVLPPGYTLALPNDRIFVFQTGVVFQRNLNARRLGGELLLERRLFTGNTLVVGAAAERESTFSLRALSNLDIATRLPLPSFQPIPEIVPPTERRIVSVFAEDSWTRGRLGLVAGLRLDDYSDAGTTVSPRASLVWRFPGNLNLKAGYARALRVPSFAERFFSSPAVLANPDLDPETVDTFEGGFIWRRRNLRVAVSAYLTALRDRIASPPPSSPTAARSLRNTPGVDARGIEASLSQTLGPNRTFTLGYAFQHPVDARTGERIAGAPSHLAAIGGSLGLGPRLIVAPELILRGGRPRAPGDTRAPLGAHALANATVRLRALSRGLELSLSLHNLFDRPYLDPAPAGGLPGDYPRAGRSLFVKARYKF